MTFTPDTGNGLFEAGGAVFIWVNAWKLWKDREVKGVYWPLWIFYTGWGFWNLYYYPSLGQWFSFYAGAVLVLGNFAWLWMAAQLWWRRRRPLRVRPWRDVDARAEMKAADRDARARGEPLVDCRECIHRGEVVEGDYVECLNEDLVTTEEDCPVDMPWDLAVSSTPCLGFKRRDE